jgi:hypothetical protein
MSSHSDSRIYWASSAEPGRAEVEAALAGMTPAERLGLYWRAQEVAIARSWALLERSGVTDPRSRVELVVRSRYPEWSDEEVARLLDAICRREDPAVWLERLRLRAQTAALDGGHGMSETEDPA